MNTLEMRAFARVVKLAADPVSHAAGTAAEFETMNPAKWKQTLKDVPVAVLGSALGYGVVRTGTELFLKHLRDQGITRATSPRWARYLDLGVGTAGTVAAFTAAMQRNALKKRRLAASAAAETRAGEK